MPIRRARSRDGTNDPIRRPPSRGGEHQQQQPQDNGHLSEPLLLLHRENSLSSPNNTLNRGHISSIIDMESPAILSSPSSMRKIYHSPSYNNYTSNSNNSNHNNHNTSSRSVFFDNIHSRYLQPMLLYLHHTPDSMYIMAALCAWYIVGVVAICTTKLLLSTPMSEGGVPSPLVLTLQQMVLGSTALGLFCTWRGPLQAWPRDNDHLLSNSEDHHKSHCNNNTDNNNNKMSGIISMLDFLLLAGLFNGLDFLASNTSFSHSSASFVETIKASEPITTTALAIWWGMDRLGKMETLSLTILILGVLMSTYANATSTLPSTSSDPPLSLSESVKTCLTVMTANLCFAFRAMAQKLLRSSAVGSASQLDDFNLLFRMQQTGAASLLIPVLLFQRDTLLGLVWGRSSATTFQWYIGVSLVNAWAFATYSLASCYILSRISVVQHSGFGCLRRLFAIITTSIAFSVPISLLGYLGILMSIFGFSGFTHYRFQKQSKKSFHSPSLSSSIPSPCDLSGTSFDNNQQGDNNSTGSVTVSSDDLQYSS